MKLNEKTLDFLYNDQNKKRPKFFVYLCEFKTLIIIAISLLISIYYDYFYGVVLFVVFIWWNIQRVIIANDAKLTNKKNVFYVFNALVKRFYESNNSSLTELLAKRILVEKKDEKKK